MPHNFKVVAIRQNLNIPYTNRMKELYNYDERMKKEKEKENEENCKKLEAQKAGLESIREHMLKRKKEVLCHQIERLEKKIQQKRKAEREILEKYNINLQSSSTRLKIARKLLEYNRNERIRISKQKQRMLNIIKNLLEELEEKDKIPVKPTFKPVKKVQETFEEIPINLPPMEEEDEIIEEEQAETKEWEDLVPPPSKKEKKRKKKEKKEKKEKKGKKEKKAKKTKKGKKDKAKSKKEKGKKKQKKEPETTIPIFPIKNPREKLKLAAGEEIKANEMIPVIDEFNQFLDRKEDYLNLPDLRFARETQFSSRPPILEFKEFENGKTYKKKLLIQNTGIDIVLCKYHKIILNNELCDTNFEVEQINIKKVYPGKNFAISVTFRPINVKKLYGYLIFLTRKVNCEEYKQFEVPVKCEIASTKITIAPKTVIFQPIPYWEVSQFIKEKRYSNVKITNHMLRECMIIIRKRAEEEVTTSITDTSIRSSTFSTISEDEERRKKMRKRSSARVSRLLKKQTSETTATSTTDYAGLYAVKDMLDLLLDPVIHFFYFDTYLVHLPAKKTIDLKIYMKNVERVGSYQEIYEIEHVIGKFGQQETLRTENLLVHCEVTGLFVTTESEYLDFNVCVINSVYQQITKIHNNGPDRIKLGFLFPAKVKKYFSIFPQTIYLKPNSFESVAVRFLPRADIFTGTKYYDPLTKILSFPIKIQILLPKESTVPPTMLTTYAILTENDNLIIKIPEGDNYELDDRGIPIINLGKVTTQETVKADILIENLSIINQEFGFLNLPECIAINPNYGFGSLKPNEVKKLQILFSPTTWDMITPENRHVTESVEVTFKITCTTILKLGGIPEPKSPEVSKLEKLRTISEINKTEIPKTEENVETNPEAPFGLQNIEEEIIIENIEEEILEDAQEEEEQPIKKQSNTRNLSLIIKATIIEYWTELRHQYIIFPDTPMGAYTTMCTEIAAVNNNSSVECVCGFIKKTVCNFDCNFEIFGGHKDVSIEPICGYLKKGQKMKLMLIVRPTVENHVLGQMAKVYKTERIKSAQTETKKKEKPKKQKKEKKQVKKQNENAPPINVDKLSFHNCDYYLAEKQLSSSIKPYTIRANFFVVVTFGQKTNRPPELLYLTIECKVIRPEFVTSLQTQFINFGPTLISTKPRHIIHIQNVSRRSIYPRVSPLSPVGPFFCSLQTQVELQRELILKVPLTFAPQEEKLYKEYFEIVAENTTESVMVAGEGIKPVYEFLPVFKICRLKAKYGKFADCTFAIENKCKLPLSLNLIKTCELEGKIEVKPADPESPKSSADKEKHKKREGSGKKSPKKRKSGKEKIKKFSEDLSSNEEYSLKNFFDFYTGPPQFKVLNALNDEIIALPQQKTPIKIRFGFQRPKSPKKKKEKPEKGKKKSKEESVTPPPTPVEQEFVIDRNSIYVAKYNILLGNVTLIKDIVIIASYK